MNPVTFQKQAQRINALSEECLRKMLLLQKKQQQLLHSLSKVLEQKKIQKIRKSIDQK